jgi:hypothetical protein
MIPLRTQGRNYSQCGLTRRFAVLTARMTAQYPPSASPISQQRVQSGTAAAFHLAADPRQTAPGGRVQVVRVLRSPV